MGPCGGLSFEIFLYSLNLKDRRSCIHSCLKLLAAWAAANTAATKTVVAQSCCYRPLCRAAATLELHKATCTPVHTTLLLLLHCPQRQQGPCALLEVGVAYQLES